MTIAQLTSSLDAAFFRGRISRALFVAGPAFAVSVGYVDPGNWATDLAAGRYAFALLWVVVLAGAMAAIAQTLSVRLTLATGETFATTLARRWPRGRLWFFSISQASAIATDLAEFTGIVVGLHLLFGLAQVPAAMIAALIVCTLLLLSNGPLRRIEIVLMGFVGIIAAGYVYELTIIHPAFAAIVRGAATPKIPEPAAFAVVVGIIGATVMPHNLFLHSACIQERLSHPIWRDRRSGMRWFSLETIVALAVATIVNGAILIVGASVGGAGGSIEQAYRSILPLAGVAAAAVFGITLLFAGIAASTSATIAGDSIAKDLSPLRWPRWARRMVTLAPAVFLVMMGCDATAMLIWSQVALSLALPFLLLPLVVLCTKRDVAGSFTLPPALLAAAVLTTTLCIAFDIALLLLR